jgi:hypothetical protein
MSLQRSECLELSAQSAFTAATHLNGGQDMAKGSSKPGKEVRKPKKDAKKPAAGAAAAAPKVEPLRAGKVKKEK